MKITKLNYVDVAEKTIENLIEKSRWNRLELTTTQIRNILAMVSEIYNEVLHEEGDKLTEKTQERIQYLKLHVVYSCGREKEVRKFVDEAKIINMIDSVGDNKNQFLLFCKYMEALVAYHRYKGGNDK